VPYQGYADGLYLLKQQSAGKGVEHYGILDVGNRLRHPQVNYPQPIVVHQTPPSLRLDWLQNTGAWSVLARIEPEQSAVDRIRKAFEDPKYDLFGNNCEHFARYVATGRRQSTQLRAAVVVAGLAALAVAVFAPRKSGG
jgi:hypothetical protein